MACWLAPKATPDGLVTAILFSGVESVIAAFHPFVNCFTMIELAYSYTDGYRPVLDKTCVRHQQAKLFGENDRSKAGGDGKKCHEFFAAEPEQFIQEPCTTVD